MSNVNDLSMADALQNGNLGAVTNRLKELLARPEMQSARMELLKTPQGAALLEQAGNLCIPKGFQIHETFRAAGEQVAAEARRHGVPEGMVESFKVFLKDIPNTASANDSHIIEWLNEAKSVTGGENWGDVSSIVASGVGDKLKISDVRQEMVKQAARSAVSSPSQVQSASQASTPTVSIPKSSQLPTQEEASTVVGDSTLNSYLEKTASSDPLTAANTTDVDYNIMTELSYARKYCNTEEFRIACERDGVTVDEYCKELLIASAKTPEGVKDRAAYLEKLRNDPEALASAELNLDRQEREFLEGLRKNSRYSQLTIDHADGLDTGNVNTQVIVVRTSDNHAIIAVQGTNGTTTDWINDMKFPSSEPTEEELYLYNKIESYVGEYDSFDLTGHSQGGRNAVTVAILLSDEDKAKLRKVISQDGPGFTPEFIANYNEQISAIEDKVINIRPQDSRVGQIFIPIGDVKYVFPQSTGFNSHDHRNWIIAVDEDGNPIGVFVEGEPDSTTQLITDLTLYAAERFEPVVIEETLPILIRLLADPNDPTALDFRGENLLANLDTVSFSDGLMLLSMGAVLISDGLLHLIDECGPYLDATGKLLTILSVLPWPGAPVCATLAGIISNIEEIVAAVEKICEVISFICNKYLEYKAEQMRREREEYIAGNTKIEMDYAQLRAAKASLESACENLYQAIRSGETIWDHFEQRRIDEKESLIENILKTVWEVVTIALSPSKAKDLILHAADAAFDVTIGLSKPYCEKGPQAISRIITAANSIAVSASTGSSEERFTVIPSSLGEHAVEAQKFADNMLRSINEANDSVNDAGSIWQADDYTSIKGVTNETIDQILKQVEAIKATYGTVADLAENYSVLQKTAVQEFQAAAN